MKMTPVKSSNIESVGYDDITKRLDVKFKGGKTFCYADVTRDEHAQLMAADSVGKHFSAFIKPIKACTKSTVNPKDALIAVQALQIMALRRHVNEIIKIAKCDPVDCDILAIAEAALEASRVEDR